MHGASFFRLPIALLVAIAALFVSTGAQPAFAASQIPCRPGQPCTTWGVMTTQNPGTQRNVFAATAAVSATNLWAGGSKTDTAAIASRGAAGRELRSGARSTMPVAGRPLPRPGAIPGPKDGCGCAYYALIEHWNGLSWSVATHPASSVLSSEILGMGAISSNDVWAVGDLYNATSGHYEGLIEHWNGTTWSAVSAGPVLQDEYLNGVAGVSANDVWAVGTYTDTISGLSVTETKHWNGSNWSLVSSPNPTDGGNSINGALNSVTAIAANDVWAVGGLPGTLAEHWDGAQWSIVASPDGNGASGIFYGVSAVASNDVWAVGGGGARGGAPPFAEHWNGSNWSVVPVPTATSPGGFLFGVVAAGLGNLWAVGYLNDPSSGAATSLIERYNGSAWAQQTPPTPVGTQSLLAVSASVDGTVLAVGYYQAPTANSNVQTLAIQLGRVRR
jgi:hypothetical protein